MPNARPSEPIDHLDPKASGRLGRLDQFLGGPLAHPFRIAVPVNIIRQNRLVPFVDKVADRLPYQVRGNGVALEPVSLELLATLVTIRLVGFGHFKVVPPASELHAIIAK